VVLLSAAEPVSQFKADPFHERDRYAFWPWPKHFDSFGEDSNWAVL
jgi:hypothetical protein